ncbi:fatty acyl-CoA synthetase family protein [Medicago truncatula]|uniref:Fatty acyl-CoA synthetase family protein n=1 Tax=Medicago truncatula TaxID=3880 RepID=A0A072USA6_MEDTR|nr:fatty acyl-CoA synthetase family protein [Medicago truncatula]
MTSSFKTLNKQFPLLPPFHHPHKFPHHHSSSSSSINYSYTPIFSSSQFRSSSCSTSQSTTYMEVFKAIAKQEAAAHGSVAIRADQQSYSYKQLISSAQKISNLLCGNDVKGNLGGARIGIVAKPSAEFVAGVLATWFSGGVAVPLALSYPEVELLYVMNNSDVSAILSTEDHSELMQSIANKTSSQFFHIPPVPNNSSEKSRNGHSKNGEIDADSIFPENIERSSEDPALILYTSGTTGKPKGVVHTHRSILAQVQTLTKAWGYTSADQFLHCLPLHHIHEKKIILHVHGIFNGLLAPLYAGSTVEFLPKFSVSGIWKRWRESYPTEGSKADGAITVFTGVPTMYTRLIQGYRAMDPELQATSASGARNLRLMMCGSSALPQPVMQEWESITGHRLLERYGMTEFVMALSNPLNGERKAGTVGKPFPGVQVKILADEEHEGEETGAGELCVKSPSLFKEYWKLPEVTKESFTDDGFFKTGDAVTTDKDGYFIILGRTNADIIKSGGYKLSALEIESVILEHPTVSECCVLGLPDKDYGEIVCAIIVPKEKQDKESKPPLSLEELSNWAKNKLAPYKIPTQLIVWETLPRNAMGKVNKKELKKLVPSEQ